MRKAKWTKATVTVTLGTRECESIVCDAVPGLAVTERVAESHVGHSFEKWSVTHVPSGYRVAAMPSQAKAKALVLALAGVADWAKDARSLATGEVATAVATAKAALDAH